MKYVPISQWNRLVAKSFTIILHYGEKAFKTLFFPLNYGSLNLNKIDPSVEKIKSLSFDTARLYSPIKI